MNHPVRKRRTRSHVIADLSANHVERFALLCGYSVERIAHDYGIDLILFTYDANGEIDSGQVFLQLKATDAPLLLADGVTISFTVERSDLELWLNEPMPVILVVYDASADRARWLYVQACFEARPDFDPNRFDSQTLTVHLPPSNVLDTSALRLFAGFRDDVLRQVQGIIHHVVR